MCEKIWRHSDVTDDCFLPFLFSESGSDLGPAAGTEDPGKLGSTGGRERGSSETSGLDLLSRGSPQPQRPRASAWHYTAEPRTYRATHGVIFHLHSYSVFCHIENLHSSNTETVNLEHAILSLIICFCRCSWRSWTKSSQRLKMLQNPASTRAFLNNKFPHANDHSQVNHHENSKVFIVIRALTANVE